LKKVSTAIYVNLKDTDHLLAVQEPASSTKSCFGKLRSTWHSVYVIHTDMLKQTNVPDREQCQWLTAYKTILQALVTLTRYQTPCATLLR